MAKEKKQQPSQPTSIAKVAGSGTFNQLLIADLISRLD